MAEPAGFFVEISIDEKSFKQLLNKSFSQGVPKKKVGYYLSALLYDCEHHENVLVVNYEKATETCFIAWMLDHFEAENTEVFYELFPIISNLKKPNTIDYAVIASTCDIFEIREITSRSVKKLTIDEYPKDKVHSILDKFWSFAESRSSFPKPDKALRKRNYLNNNFKNYFKRYVRYKEELQKPQRIAVASLQNPFHLFGDFYTYNGKVYDFGVMYEFTQKIEEPIIELPFADPFSLRNEAGIVADKNFVFGCYLTSGSLPQTTLNDQSIWEYRIETGIDGESFTYLGDPYEVIYYKDARSVYVFDNARDKLDRKWVLNKIELADSLSFVHLDFCYGKDKNHTFYYDKTIAIDPNKHTINRHGFIYDDRNIFHYGNKICLDAPSFQVIEFENDTNPFIGRFILADKNGQYEYESETTGGVIKRKLN
ncbi:hypothetical protein R3X26_14280 [Vibrio sp. TH_r3]|uniref:hypothetical protein n=1 Tax=Vibrio sp. TH_r3 TaxID=3082084 RepID=UPI002955A0A2|nr:hypothetical protein [Vibrio sp. TH_r3]MDV7105571.1 hypothetical protein [Vibrio sp. TH_r3]